MKRSRPSGRESSVAARTPRTLLPAASRGGEKCSRPPLPGETVTIPPPMALYSGDAETAHTKFRFVLEAGEAFDDVDLRTFGRLGLGRSLLHLGDEDAGLALLDDAMVTVIGGETSPTVSGIIYCAVIESCHVILDLRRAREWTDALERWCEAQPDLVPFRGQCLIHRAQIMTLTGSWQSAMDEAGRARARLAATHDPRSVTRSTSRPSCIASAVTSRPPKPLYVEAGGHGREPQPGLALVRLAQGQHAAALAALRRSACGGSRAD